MKKGITISILVIIVVAFSGALYYLYNKNKQPDTVYQTDKLEVKTIVKKTIATGNIVPKEEVEIKPNIVIDTMALTPPLSLPCLFAKKCHRHTWHQNKVPAVDVFLIGLYTDIKE